MARKWLQHGECGCYLNVFKVFQGLRRYLPHDLPLHHRVHPPKRVPVAPSSVILRRSNTTRKRSCTRARKWRVGICILISAKRAAPSPNRARNVASSHATKRAVDRFGKVLKIRPMNPHAPFHHKVACDRQSKSHRENTHRVRRASHWQPSPRTFPHPQPNRAGKHLNKQRILRIAQRNTELWSRLDDQSPQPSLYLT